MPSVCALGRHVKGQELEAWFKNVRAWCVRAGAGVGRGGN